MTDTADLSPLLARAEAVLQRLESWLPPAESEVDWSAHAWRWRVNPNGNGGHLAAVYRPHGILLSDLRCVDVQRDEIDRNTRQFLTGSAADANNVLLWGSRGTGKSSLIKALFNTYRQRGLRLIEVDKEDLIHLPDILDVIQDRPERFILFCDDLSFDADESGYKALKAVLDGSISAAPENLLIYATSNRRHLLPEFQRDNQQSRLLDGEIHHGEGVEEKISLSDRFGLWLAFHPFSQDDYLGVVHHWLNRLEAEPLPDERAQLERFALQWALRRGSRSGRTAWQFARDHAGRAKRGETTN